MVSDCSVPFTFHFHWSDKPELDNSLSPLRATCAELQERQGASPALPSSGEPLNPTSIRKDGLSSAHIGEGKHDFDGETAIGRIPVVSASGMPLMPCRPAKARKLLKEGKAIKKWSKLGMFYIQLKFDPQTPAAQPVAVGVDPGFKFEGFSVVGTKDTVLNIMSEAVDWVKKAVEQRRMLRRNRRYRKTRRRKARFNNRHRKSLPPSTKARWDAKLRIIAQLKKIIPIQVAVVEDVKAVTRKGKKKWNTSFSPLEYGKQYFYSALKEMGLNVVLKRGTDTKELREKFGLEKLKNKSKAVFETHCVDAWVLAASETGAKQPTTKSLYYLVPLRWHRRQLHYSQPQKGGIRRRYGGTISLGLKKGTLVKHIKYGLCYIGGNFKNRFSLHSLKDGKRTTHNAKREDLKILTRITWRSQFIPRMN